VPVSGIITSTCGSNPRSLTSLAASKIARINIIGTKAYGEAELLKQMTLTTPGWLTWYTKNDQYSKQKLQADLEALRSFYQNRGYLEFEIESTQVSISPDREDIYITINVHEGPRYMVSDVRLAGDLQVDEAELRALVQLRAGEVYSRFSQKQAESNQWADVKPHVSILDEVFVETVGGTDVLIVKHLGDARPGRERWDLDSDPFRGLNSFFLNTSDVPSLAASPTTPYVAWQEDARFGNTTDVFEARRLPEGPAWGSNRPPFIRVISGTLNLAAQKQLPLSPDAPDQSANDVIGMTTITSSCDHVNGWDGLAEVRVLLSDEMGTYFHGRYVAAEDKVYLEDPDNPGTWLGGIQIGTGSPIETRHTTLYVDRMTKTSHGPESAALDIEWVIGFKRPLLGKTLVQSLNLLYNTESGVEESGPFQVGSLNVAVDQIVLPLISKNPLP